MSSDVRSSASRTTRLRRRDQWAEDRCDSSHTTCNGRVRRCGSGTAQRHSAIRTSRRVSDRSSRLGFQLPGDRQRAAPPAATSESIDQAGTSGANRATRARVARDTARDAAHELTGRPRRAGVGVRARNPAELLRRDAKRADVAVQMLHREAASLVTPGATSSNENTS